MARKADDPILALARRTQILNAATRIFAEKGFHRATIRDVAGAAGLADGTIYNYFENKTALLLGLLNRINQSEQREQHYEQATDGDLRDFLRRYMRQRFETITDTGFDLFQILFAELLINSQLRELYAQQVIEPTLALTERYVQQWEAAGLIRLREPRLSLRLMAAMTVGLIMLRIMGDTELAARWDELPDLVVDLLLQGIEQTKGGHA
jgi:AcrR family transcriptional regulator